MEEIKSLFPSQDGNEKARNIFISQISTLITEIDHLKDPSKLTLGNLDLNQISYKDVGSYSKIPNTGRSIHQTIEHLLKLSEGHRFVNANYVANAAPLPNTASIIGTLLMTLLNGNNLWDVESLTASKLEISLTKMLSEIIGFDSNVSGGYTTWGGQGATFNSLRIAITKQFPNSNEVGIPPNLYCFCSELSHYSLLKSVEATGIGTNNLIRIKTNKDHSMDIEDLQVNIERVIENGGIPLYILATMGTTDTFGIDNIVQIKEVTTYLESKFKLAPLYIHADTAMGGMFTFFNNYNFEENHLMLESDVIDILKNFSHHFQNVYLADSMVFDFHKLGQTPYTSSFFIIKNEEHLKFVDLDPEETPYVGKREYGKYHTSYTLECSRMGSSIPIYASLITFGLEGYQKLLANYIRVNILFRKELLKCFNHVAVTNDISPVTTFRFYPEKVLWDSEQSGLIHSNQIGEINQFNEAFGEMLGIKRQTIYFGNTKRQSIVQTLDNKRFPIYAHKFFSISPYTTVEEVHRYIDFLSQNMKLFLENQLTRDSNSYLA